MDDLVKTYKDKIAQLEKSFERPRKALERFPTLFLLLGTAGLVLVFLGLERLFEQIPLLGDNPLVMVFLGIIILFFTGQLYKKLS